MTNSREDRAPGAGRDNRSTADPWRCRRRSLVLGDKRPCRRNSRKGRRGWLEENGVKLSAVTISKALRNPKPYWEELFEATEPAARIVEKVQQCGMEEFLLREEVFLGLGSKPPALEASTVEGASNAFEEYEGAVKTLKQQWFCFSRKTREACLANVKTDSEKSINQTPEDRKQ